MAQKNLPILNRTGIFQRWLNLWDSAKNYYYVHRQHLFFSETLKEFIEHRNRINPFLVDQTYCDLYIGKVEAVPSDATYFDMVNLIRAHWKKRFRYIYLGQIIMIKIQNWFIFIIYVYKPEVIYKIAPYIPPVSSVQFVYHFNRIQANINFYDEQKNSF